MSEHSPGAKPDLLIPTLILVGMIAVAYVYVAPFRLFLKGILCIWYGILSFVVLDVKSGKTFLDLAEVLINNYKYKHIILSKGPGYFEDILSQLIANVRVRFFVFYALLFVVISYLFKKNAGHVPFFYGDFNLRELIRKKYGLKLKFDKKGRIAEPVDRLYAKISRLKKKKNFPINLVARFFPPDSRERVFLYTGSHSYRFVPVKMEKTLSDYLIESAEKEKKNVEKREAEELQEEKF